MLTLWKPYTAALSSNLFPKLSNFNVVTDAKGQVLRPANACAGALSLG